MMHECAGLNQTRVILEPSEEKRSCQASSFRNRHGICVRESSMTRWLFVPFDVISERKKGHKDGGKMSRGFSPRVGIFLPQGIPLFRQLLPPISPLRTVIYHVQRLLDSPGCLQALVLIQKISASLTSTGSFSSTSKSIVNRCYRTL